MVLHKLSCVVVAVQAGVLCCSCCGAKPVFCVVHDLVSSAFASCVCLMVKRVYERQPLLVATGWLSTRHLKGLFPDKAKYEAPPLMACGEKPAPLRRKASASDCGTLPGSDSQIFSNCHQAAIACIDVESPQYDVDSLLVDTPIRPCFSLETPPFDGLVNRVLRGR